MPSSSTSRAAPVSPAAVQQRPEQSPGARAAQPLRRFVGCAHNHGRALDGGLWITYKGFSVDNFPS